MNALATVVAVEPTGWSGRRYHPPTTPAPLSRSDVIRTNDIVATCAEGKRL